MPKPRPGFFLRIKWLFVIYGIKLATVLHKYVLNYLRAYKPTYLKHYAALPMIQNNVFLPKTWKKGDPPLPLLIDIHGGGFTVGAPAIDNLDNFTLASYGICVVSIGYRLAPAHQFPGPVYDVAALISAVLDDRDLPIDRNKVAIIGYSAGGNLALAAPQLNDLHTRIKGVVACYPVTDTGRKMTVRGETAVAPPGKKDILWSMSPMFHWAYFPENVDLKDPLLGPLWAERNKICEKVYMIGCEYDLLCTEAEETAEAYAKVDREFEKTGQRVELGGGRVGWKEGNVTWEKLMGLEHGFNSRMDLQSRAVAKQWKERMMEMHKNIADWLFAEVYV